MFYSLLFLNLDARLQKNQKQTNKHKVFWICICAEWKPIVWLDMIILVSLAVDRQLCDSALTWPSPQENHGQNISPLHSLPTSTINIPINSIVQWSWTTYYNDIPFFLHLLLEDGAPEAHFNLEGIWTVIPSLHETGVSVRTWNRISVGYCYQGELTLV